MKNVPRLFLLISFAMSSCNLIAQQSSLGPSFLFETFELPGGELGNHVQAIAQDSFGFMWFGSQFGLHRWDGSQLKTYFNDVSDSTSIASNYVEYIYVAKDGTLWLGHWGKGLDRFDYETETFEHYVYNANDVNNLGSSYVAEMTEDREGYLWIATQYGVYRMDVKTGESKSFLPNPEDPHSLSYGKCRTLFMDSEGVLWFGTGYPFEPDPKGGLNRYRPETEDFVHYFHNPHDSTSLINNKVSEIFEDSRGNFWVGTVGDGLHLMDRRAGKFQRLQGSQKKIHQLSGPCLSYVQNSHIRIIFEDLSHKLWIGAWQGGIKYYDPDTKYMKDYYANVNDPQSLPEKFPWKIYQSRDKTIWGCTAGPKGSLFKIKPTSFDIYPATTTENSIYSFCETGEQKLWIGTEKRGLLKLDLETGEQTFFNPSVLRPVSCNISVSDLNPDDLKKNNLLNEISKIVEDSAAWLWLKKWNIGLLRLHPETGKVKYYRHDPKDENSIGKGGITDIIRDEKNRIWILTTMGDLNLYEPMEDHFIRYKFANPGTGFYYHSVLGEAEDDKLWIAGSGLNFDHLPFILTRFDPETGKFEYINTDSSSVTPNAGFSRVYKVEEDDWGNVWMAGDAKLKKINLDKGAWKVFDASQFGLLFF